MMSTIDGRIITENWGSESEKLSKIYEACHDQFDAEAWMVGRVTMEKDFTEGLEPLPVKGSQPVDRKAFIGDRDATSFAIAIDGGGKLGWDGNAIDGDHVIAVLTEKVGDDYLAYLQQQKVSYVFAGKDSIDFSIALEQLGEHFPIKTIMLEGGGHINGSMLQAGLIDEISLLLLPMADGNKDMATSFEIDASWHTKATALKLIKMEEMEEGVIWLRYEVGPGAGEGESE